MMGRSDNKDLLRLHGIINSACVEHLLYTCSNHCSRCWSLMMKMMIKVTIKMPVLVSLASHCHGLVNPNAEDLRVNSCSTLGMPIKLVTELFSALFSHMPKTHFPFDDLPLLSKLKNVQLEFPSLPCS